LKYLKYGLFVLLMVILFVSLVEGVAAKPVIPFNEPTVTDSNSMESDLNLPKEDQKLVIKAVKTSDLSQNEKIELIKNLKDIWSDKSDLSESEQKQVLTDAASILNNYLGSDKPELTILWNWEPHSDLAKTAGEKWGVPSTYCQILYSEANSPDYWLRYFGDHFWYVSYQWGDAPSKTKYYADKARDDIENNDLSNGFKELSWSMHYMSDLANPWHTSVLYGQAYHTTYEDYVGRNWNSGHNFYQTIENDWYYYYISDPEASAKNLATVSNQYQKYLVKKIRTDPDWENNPNVASYTRTVLTHGIRYDTGLVQYTLR
jgi:hypothetical protein